MHCNVSKIKFDFKCVFYFLSDFVSLSFYVVKQTNLAMEMTFWEVVFVAFSVQGQYSIPG